MMKKRLLSIALCITLLFSFGALAVSAVPGYYCGSSEEYFAPVGDVEITWDPQASEKLFLYDGMMDEWVEYPSVWISPDNMVSWVGGSVDNQAGGVPEGWGVEAYFVADPDWLYIGLRVTDPDVVLVQNASNYAGAGDAFQMAFDFDRVLGKLLEEDYDQFSDVPCIFYSFGPMGEFAYIQIMRQNSDGNDGIISEANGDGIQGVTALADNGWCAEFAFAWDRLYSDFEYRAYADDSEISVAEDDPLEVGCALYYLDRTAATGNHSVNWAAGTLPSQKAGVVPELTWTPLDNGIHLFLPYNDDLWFNCKGIEVQTSAVDTPEPEPPVETEEIYTEEPPIPETDAPTRPPEKPASTEAVTRVIEYRPVEPNTPQHNVPSGMIMINCGSVITPTAGVLFSAVALGTVWMLKKKKEE